MSDSKIQPNSSLDHDHALAMHIARHECAAAGMGSPEKLTDAFVCETQRQRLDSFKSTPRETPAPLAPVGKKRAASPVAAPAPKKPAAPSSVPNLISKPESLNASRFNGRFAPVGGGSSQEFAASAAHAPKLRAALASQCDMVEVRGDGNCGFYAVLAGVVRMAVEQLGLRKTIAQNIRALANADHTDGLKAIAQHPAHEDALSSLEEGRHTLNVIADALESSNPAEALATIEDPWASSHIKHATNLMRAKATEVESSDGEPAGCGFARSEELLHLTSALVGPSAGCTVFTTRVRHDEQTVNPEDIAAGLDMAGTLYMLQSNNNHYDLLVPKAVR